MNKTANFQLTQWEKTDRIMMEDFNRDNDAIDAALAQMQLLAQQAASARAERGRQCRVFGICGGAALAILLL